MQLGVPAVHLPLVVEAAAAVIRVPFRNTEVVSSASTVMDPL